jgi:hypothetical protein
VLKRRILAWYGHVTRQHDSSSNRSSKGQLTALEREAGKERFDHKPLKNEIAAVSLHFFFSFCLFFFSFFFFFFYYYYFFVLSIALFPKVYTTNPVFCIDVSGFFLSPSTLPKGMSLICVPLGQLMCSQLIKQVAVL